MWIDDQILSKAENDFVGAFWEPVQPLVVLGRSNIAAVECAVAECAEDQVSIVQRSGGGGTVVLFPGCAVISCGVWVSKTYHNDHYFKLINQAAIETLAAPFPVFKELAQSGISDISFHGRKCAGTSMFRSRNYLLYQASILVECDLEIISRYLQHPSREPDYRKGRAHQDFLIGLSDLCVGLTTEEVVFELEKNFERCLRSLLGEELVAPPAEQIEYIKAKANNQDA